MSGGAFGSKEAGMLDILCKINDRLDDGEYLLPEVKDYMEELTQEIVTVYKKIKQLDYYLSGDSSEYK